jgi:hypothetical protein
LFFAKALLHPSNLRLWGWTLNHRATQDWGDVGYENEGNQEKVDVGIP